MGARQVPWQVALEQLVELLAVAVVVAGLFLDQAAAAAQVVQAAQAMHEFIAGKEIT